MIHLKTILIEEEGESKNLFSNMLFKENSFQVKIIDAVKDVQAAVPLIKTVQPDLVLVNTLPTLTKGFELFKYFNRLPFKIIFFIDNQETHLRVLQNSALHYLLKPIDLSKLKSMINHIYNGKNGLGHPYPTRRKTRESALDLKIRIPNTSGFDFIKTADILRCEADGRYTRFYLTNGKKYLSAKNIGAYEKLLVNHSFLRVHRSHIVNIHKIKKYVAGRSPFIVLEDGSKILIATSKRQILIETLEFIY